MENEMKQENQLAIVGQTINDIKGHIAKICGVAVAPRKIADEGELKAVVDNIGTLTKMSQIVETHYKPLKASERAKWQKVIDEEKAWLDSIKTLRDYSDKSVGDYNRAIREARDAELRKKADEEAAAKKKAFEEEQARLEAERKAAIEAGNTQAAEVIAEKVAVVVEQKESVQAEFIVPTVTQTKGDQATQGEKEVIEEFVIVDEQAWVEAMVTSGLSYLVHPDNKTITAFKEMLLTKKTLNTYPGIQFKRGVKNTYNNRRSK